MKVNFKLNFKEIIGFVRNGEVCDKIKDTLQYNDGMPWTEIRTKLGLEQIVPDHLTALKQSRHRSS